MILIGDINIECETITPIKTIKDISSTLANSTVLYNFDFDLMHYTQKNVVDSCVVVLTLQELIYASQFQIKYIVISQELSKNAQDIANNYMFDSKILVVIEAADEIVTHALNEIDGVIYKRVVENGTN